MINSMNFEGYIVERLSLELNPSFESPTGMIDLNPDFNSQVLYSETSYNGLIEMRIKIGEQGGKESPFELEAIISGSFNFSGEIKEDEKPTSEDISRMKDMLAMNGNAILYPYLRSLVSNLTLMSNQFPAYTLPTFNFVELLKKTNSIQFDKLEA